MTVRRLAKRIGQQGAPLPGGRLRRVAGIGMGVALLCAAWEPTMATSFGEHGAPTMQAGAPGAGTLQQRQVAFLHRLRQSDPRSETIERAVFNTQNELGVILSRHVEMEAVRPLLRTLLTQMARAFPGQNLTVIAYAPSEPPREIGTARRKARTREMTYTPAVRE